MNFLVNAAFTDNGPNNIIGPETDDDRMRFKIEELKQVCRNTINESPNDFDPRDVKSLDSGDIGIALFLESNDWKVDAALEALKRHCFYRRENGVLDLKVTDIPRELHQTGLFMAKGFDKSGHPICYFRMSISPGPKEFHPLIIKYFLQQCETIRNCVLSCNKKLAIIFDCRHAQVDIGLLKQILDIYTQKYPPAAEYIAFVDMTFGFRMVLQVIKYFFPKYLWSKMMFIDRAELDNMVDKDNLPFYLGGNIEPLTKVELSQVPSFMEYAKSNGIEDKRAEKMLSLLMKQIST